MSASNQTHPTVASLERQEIPAIDADELRALPENQLTMRILQAASAAVATSAAHELLSRTSFPHGNVPIPLATQLTPEQRAVAEITARRDGLLLWPFAMPKARTTRARWLGLEPPTALEKNVSTDIGGQPVSLPFWAARFALRLPWPAAALTLGLSRRELLDVYAQCLRNGGYDGLSVNNYQEVWDVLAEYADDFVPQAEALLEEATRLWASTDPHVQAERGTWTSPRANELLAYIMLYPLALAGRTLGPDAAAFVPLRIGEVGERNLGRTILMALRDDLREATLLAAYEGMPTLTAVHIATDILRFLPLPALAQRAARDFYDPALKKSIPKVPFERVAGRVAALCNDMPELAPFFEKPKVERKKPTSSK